jgi:phosphoglycolate phosphatase
VSRIRKKRDRISVNSGEAQEKLGRLKAVVFDFDGTLAVLNIDFSLMKEQVVELMRQVSVDEGSVKEKYLLEMIDEVYERLCRESAASAEGFYRKAHRVLQTVELKAAGESRLLPGVKEALGALRTQGFKIGIVTRNCEGAVRKVFPDIERFCDVFISRDSTRKVKPHPYHLTAVLKALEVSAEETVMVGDHLLDVEAGRRVGMMTIGVLTGQIQRDKFEQAGADAVLDRATEVSAWLSRLGNGRTNC